MREELASLGVSVAGLCRALDMPVSEIADIVGGQCAISADTALRLASYFSRPARFWLNLQTEYDLAKAA